MTTRQELAEWSIDQAGKAWRSFYKPSGDIRMESTDREAIARIAAEILRHKLSTTRIDG